MRCIIPSPCHAINFISNIFFASICTYTNKQFHTVPVCHSTVVYWRVVSKEWVCECVRSKRGECEGYIECRILPCEESEGWACMMHESKWVWWRQYVGTYIRLGMCLMSIKGGDGYSWIEQKCHTLYCEFIIPISNCFVRGTGILDSYSYTTWSLDLPCM